MRRLPNKIRGNGREATFHNHMREMVKNLRPVRSANVQTRFTSSGVIRAAQRKQLKPPLAQEKRCGCKLSQRQRRPTAAKMNELWSEADSIIDKHLMANHLLG